MLKFLRKYNKMILVVAGAILMVLWLLPQALQSMGNNPASQVVPLALLVPLFGMGSAAGLLGEALQDWKLQGAALVMGGLALNAWALRRPLVRRTE